MRILYNCRDSKHKSPFGTLKAGQNCKITVHIPENIKTCKAVLELNREDGSEYKSFQMKKEGGAEGYEYYTVVFSLDEPDLYFYYFRITTENEEFSLFRYGADQTNMEDGDFWQLSCIPKDFKVPEDFAGKVMYQIFPDRYYAESVLPAEGKIEPYWVHENKDDVPDYRPDENGEVRNCDFYGGNLAGITAKLDHIKDLGVSVIYLNPIFKAYSNHRYDTADYMKIDELLGDEEDFKRLCEEAHKRDMKIILDGVFSHTGSRSRYFDIDDLWGNGAYHHPDSPYRRWYQFEEYPKKYTSWWGVKSLPCVNEMDETYRDFIIDGKDSVIAHWIKAGADGFRLDVADELPDEFIASLRARLKELKPDALLIGEVWEDASNKISYSKRRRYFTGGELDSVMNYPFRRAIIDYVCERDGGDYLSNTVMEIAEHYPEEVLHTLMNMLSTHDTPRILAELSPDKAPDEKDARAAFKMDGDEKHVAEERLSCAAFLQFILPGMPCVYYGDEIGMEGYEDPFCRGYYRWKDATPENEIFNYVKSLAKLKNSEKALRCGNISIESDGCGRVFIDRKKDEDEIFAIVNLGEPMSVVADGNVLFARNTEGTDSTVTISKCGLLLWKKD